MSTCLSTALSGVQELHNSELPGGILRHWAAKSTNCLPPLSRRAIEILDHGRETVNTLLRPKMSDAWYFPVPGMRNAPCGRA
jgi:hypothetical protein